MNDQLRFFRVGDRQATFNAPIGRSGRHPELVDKQVCRQLKAFVVTGEHENGEGQKESVADVQKIVESPYDCKCVVLFSIALLVFVLDEVGGVGYATMGDSVSHQVVVRIQNVIVTAGGQLLYDLMEVETLGALSAVQPGKMRRDVEKGSEDGLR